MVHHKTAFITGASSGIGKELALLMSESGVEVALAARRVQELEAVAREIRERGGSARVVPIDVSKPIETQDTIRKTDEEMGGLDLVVANAGVENGRWSGKLRWVEDCEDTIAVNIAGVVATLTAVSERMVERKRGHLVATSSLAGYRGLPRWALYSGSKAFVSTFLESLRIDLRSTGVSVTDVRPGYVKTPFTANATKPMPLIVDAGKAAEIIWTGIQRRQSVVEFPWQIAAALKASKAIPHALYDPVAKKIL